MPKVITVAGEVGDVTFQRCVMLCAAFLDAEDAPVDCEALSLFGPDYDRYLRKKAYEIGGEVHGHKDRVAVFVNDDSFVGGLPELVDLLREELRAPELEAPSADEAASAAREAVATARRDTKHEFCYFDVQAGGGERLVRVVFELYGETCPRTVENFRTLCTGSAGKSYRGSAVHRIVPGGWFQGGDLAGGAGDASEAAEGGLIGDESFAVKFDAPGILAMANDGPHTNGSQYFVTFDALPWMDCKAVAFGRIVQGLEILAILEGTELDENERPVDACKVVDCGVL